jgi:hypothetical protein
MDDFETLADRLKAEVRDGKSDEEIFESLKSHLGKDVETDERVADVLATLSHPVAARLLLRMLAVARSKNVMKAIKRSLYRLRGRGIAVEEIPPDQGESIFRPPKAESTKGFGSGIDSLGERFLLLVLPRPGRGWAVIQTGVSDTQGLVNFVGDEMTRKRFRTFLQELKEKFPFPLVEMEPSHVGFLIAEAYQLTLERKGTPPQDYLHFKTEIDRLKKEVGKPVVYSYLQTDETTGDDRWLRRAGDLLKEDVFSDWEIEVDQIQPYADAVWEAEESKLILNPVQKEARFQEVYQKALSELFSGERRVLYERRLEEMAEILFKLGREEEARISLAAAMDLKKPMNPFQPNPFLLQLVTNSIFKRLKDAHEKKVSGTSLIVKP